MPTTAKKRIIEVFRPGQFTTSDGKAITFTAADVAAIAANYDAAANPAPVVIGHPKTDAPAFGWASAFTFDAGDQKLRSELDQLVPEFVAAVQAGRYKRVSMALFPPEHPANPKPGAYYPRHIGFLGGAAPAVPNLQPVHFADNTDTDVAIEFDAPDFSDDQTKSIGERIAAAVMSALAAASPRVLFASRKPPEDDTMNDTDKARLAAAEAENARLKADAAAAAKKSKLDAAIAFVATFVTAKKLAPADAPALAAIVAELPVDVEFTADGAAKKEGALAVLKRILDGRDAIIETREHTPPDNRKRAPKTARFANADGVGVNAEQLAIHAAAKQYQAEHKDVSFAAAVEIVTQERSAA